MRLEIRACHDHDEKQECALGLIAAEAALAGSWNIKGWSSDYCTSPRVLESVHTRD